MTKPKLFIVLECPSDMEEVVRRSTYRSLSEAVSRWSKTKDIVLAIMVPPGVTVRPYAISDELLQELPEVRVVVDNEP